MGPTPGGGARPRRGGCRQGGRPFSGAITSFGTGAGGGCPTLGLAPLACPAGARRRGPCAMGGGATPRAFRGGASGRGGRGARPRRPFRVSAPLRGRDGSSSMTGAGRCPKRAAERSTRPPTRAAALGAIGGAGPIARARARSGGGRCPSSGAPFYRPGARAPVGGPFEARPRPMPYAMSVRALQGGPRLGKPRDPRVKKPQVVLP